jgi:hypothetical protein
VTASSSAPLAADGQVTLTVRGGGTLDVEAGAVARFGRASAVDLAVGRSPEDLLISRVAGYVDRRGGRVRVANTSSSGKILRVVPPEGAPITLPAAALWSAPAGSTAVELPGRVMTWVVDLWVEATLRTGPATDIADDPATDLLADLSDEEREVLAAVCAPLLRVPTLSQPNGYNEAAALLPGVTAKAIERRIDKLIERLVAVGTPGLAQGRWRIGSLAQLAVDHGLVVPADLDFLAARRS